MLPNFRALHWELSGGHEHGVQEPHSLVMELSNSHLQDAQDLEAGAATEAVTGLSYFLLRLRQKNWEFFAL